jgi:hypothetical protein
MGPERIALNGPEFAYKCVNYQFDSTERRKGTSSGWLGWIRNSDIRDQLNSKVSSVGCGCERYGLARILVKLIFFIEAIRKEIK